MNSSPRPDKAEVQAEALGVVVSWLRHEAHLDDWNGEPPTDTQIAWAQEAQDRVAHFIDLEIAKLRLRSKTAPVANVGQSYESMCASLGLHGKLRSKVESFTARQMKQFRKTGRRSR